MPRKTGISTQRNRESLSEMLDSIEDGPEKNKFVSFMNELDTRVEEFTSSLQKKTKDHCVALTNFLVVLQQKIPQCHQKMRVQDYFEMIRKHERKSAVRESFRVELNQLCDVEPVRPTGAMSAKKTKPTANKTAVMAPPEMTTRAKIRRANDKKAASCDYANGSSRQTAKSTQKKEQAASGLRRSRRINSSPTAVAAKKTPNYFRGVFTPKFDPRCPITPAQGLRKPNVGEKIVLMSQDGSPLSHQRKSLAGPTIIVPLSDGKAITISSDTEIKNLVMDEDMQESLRFIQKKLASLTNIPISCLSD